MACGVYGIFNKLDGKCYIGASKNIKSRWQSHRWLLRLPTRNAKSTNPHLWDAVQKDGFDNFEFRVIELADWTTRQDLYGLECKWMDHYKSYDREFGYNLRVDTEDGMRVHDETRLKHSITNMGSNNPNYGNKWSDEMRAKGSEFAKARHSSDNSPYGDKWKRLLTASSKEMWNIPGMRERIANGVSESKRALIVIKQYAPEGAHIKTWDDSLAILSEYPDWKWQNIYAACNGNKPSYQGFQWRRVPVENELDTTPLPPIKIRGRKNEQA